MIKIKHLGSVDELGYISSVKKGTNHTNSILLYDENWTNKTGEDEYSVKNSSPF